MSQNSFILADELRLKFLGALSSMYQKEVPHYAKMIKSVRNLNKNFSKDNSNLSQEHHGAIRLGTAKELKVIRRLFAVMGMHAVDYYDLTVAGIPVHSTAFRPISTKAIQVCPFRVFTSLLRLDLIHDEALRVSAEALLTKRSLISPRLLTLIEKTESAGGLKKKNTDEFIQHSLEIFRWHKNANVEKAVYDSLMSSHPLIADVVSFKGPHINHLTPSVLDIDAAEQFLILDGFKLKRYIEGPPQRKTPILLRQTSFLALKESIRFKDNIVGSHTARFGEIEQRGIALTPKGRKLYDACLQKAGNSKRQNNYAQKLKEAFKEFPDNYFELWKMKLAYFEYSINNNVNLIPAKPLEERIKNNEVKLKPINYEDFLPVSAAGIFQSNIGIKKVENIMTQQESHQKEFEKALGMPVIKSFDWYEEIEQQSLHALEMKLKLQNNQTKQAM